MMPAPRCTTASKILNGTTRADRQPRTDFAVRLTVPPDPPPEFSQTAAATWHRLAAAAVGIGTLTLADLPLLKLLVVTVEAEADARATLLKEGVTIVAGSGGRKKHPAAAIAETARAQALAMLREFGLSPRSRQSVDTAPPPKAERSPFDEFLLLDRERLTGRGGRAN